MLSTSPDIGCECATRVISRCRELALLTDVPGETTRLFLSPATRNAHGLLMDWFREAKLEVSIDDIGNLRATRRTRVGAPTLILFSHIDTVPNAGPFDGPLGVVLALEAVVQIGQAPLPFNIEIVAFSEEEGVRFRLPFLASRATVGELTEADLKSTDPDGVSVEEAIRSFGLDPARIPSSCPLPASAFAALEVHIEQGPVLESEDKSLAVVEGIAGQTRLQLTFTGKANHAGTTPMTLRHDALAAAAQLIVEAERYALDNSPLVATVGRIEAIPGAINSVTGTVHATLDVRHPKDDVRRAGVAALLIQAKYAAAHRSVTLRATVLSEQPAILMNRALTNRLQQSVGNAGYDAARMFSGAGHDAMVVAPHIPTAMLFVRSPEGLSHHPDETVRTEDVNAALITVVEFIRQLEFGY